MTETVRDFVRYLPLGLLLALAGCGGGSRSDPPAAVEQEPAAAVGSGESAAADESDEPAETPVEPTLPDPAVADQDGDGTAAAADCDDANAAIWRRVDLFADLDADGVGAGTAIATCIGDAAPAGASLASGDCADDDAARSQTLPYVARDGDDDGFVLIGSASPCTNGALPPGYLSAIGGAKTDCDDRDRNGEWLRCTRTRTAIRSGAADSRRPCIGDAVPSGFSIRGYDPVDIAGDPQSALVSDFDLDSSVLTVDSDGDDDDIF